MEMCLNEINLAIHAGQKIIVPSFFKGYTRGQVQAAFRSADMTGYTKRGQAWFKD